MPPADLVVRDIDPQGPSVRLSDGSTWQIKPGSDALGLRYWSVGDPVEVEEIDSHPFSYQLINPNTPGPNEPLTARPNG